ncbi:MAG: squalene/phytoene synthase family protein, partial [Gammaproteobacteria bacterium]
MIWANSPRVREAGAPRYDANEPVTEQSDWEAAVAPPGSSLYYSNLHLAPKKKHALLALHALWMQLEEILHGASDPGVGRIKLQWWREEIERAFRGEARHPTALVLTRSFSCFALTRRLLR